MRVRVPAAHLLALLTAWLLGTTGARADPARPRAPAPAGVTRGIAFVHQNGRVAYQARPGDSALVIIDERGREPSVSPDGRHLAFWSARPGELARSSPILVADLETRRTWPFREGNLRAPRFSPDGAELLFSEMVDGRWAALVAPLHQPAAVQVLARGDDSLYEAVWLPSGDGILAHDLRQVVWVGRDGAVRRRVDAGELTGGHGLSSADRVLPCPDAPDALVFSSFVAPSAALARVIHEASSALWRYDLSTRARTRLTGPDVYAASPAWSADGRWIYFDGLRVAGKEGPALSRGILRMPAGGGALARVAAGREPGP